MANLRHQSPRSRKFKLKLNHEPPAEAVFLRPKETKMHIEIGDKYTVEGGANDFILYVKSIVKRGKTAGQETQQRLGYYSKLEHLIRALINHEIRTGEAKTLQEMQDQITYISIWCEKAFAEVEHV